MRGTIKAWGYGLIILLNSDEILKRSPLGSRHQQMKQRRAQLVRRGAHVFLHLFGIFQFEAQQAETTIKEDDEGRGGREEKKKRPSMTDNKQTPPPAH